MYRHVPDYRHAIAVCIWRRLLGVCLLVIPNERANPGYITERVYISPVPGLCGLSSWRMRMRMRIEIILRTTARVMARLRVRWAYPSSGFSCKVRTNSTFLDYMALLCWDVRCSSCLKTTVNLDQQRSADRKLPGVASMSTS